MKQILLCALALWVAAVLQPVFADTNVSGTISTNTTWTVSGSPYVITGSVTIASDITLTIQPGVNVQFPAIRNASLYLDVKGILIAKGQSGKNIVFSGDGGGIDSYDYYNVSGPVYVESTSQNSVFQYVTFDALGFGGNRVSDNTAALDIRSTSCTVTNCIFQNTRGTGLFFEISSTAAVTGNSFNGNRIGIKLGSTSPSVTGNSFSGNSYLDVVSDMDNLGKLKNNGALKIGLTANSPMALNDTLLSTHSYRVLSTLIVTEGKTLTIQPGVNVQFPAIRNPILYLDVKGILIAKGQSGKNIVFSGDGGGIDSYDYYNVSGPVYVESTSQNSVFQYVTFDALGFGGNRVSDNTAALDIRSTSCTVTNCIFQNTRGTGLFFEISSTAAVTGNSFNGNRIGIKLGSTSPSVTGNSFSGNSYLDVVSDMDNLGKLKNNGALKIGLTANSPMALNDTLLSTHSYRVLSTLIVTEGKTLTIQPGVNVQFPAIRNPILYLDVKGILIAKGQSGKNIVFSGDGGGIDSYDYYNVSGPVYVESTSQNSVFQYVTFDALGFGGNRVSDNTAALDIRSTSCTVTNCIFQNTRGTGLFFEISSTAAVTGNSFNGNRIGIKLGSTSPSVTGNSFSGNSYLDVVSDMDNLGKLKNNGALKIGLTANSPMALNDTLLSTHSYRVLSTLIVTEGKTLTIQPGVNVQFPAIRNPILYLDIKGILIAKGQSGKNIVFSGDGGGIDSYDYYNVSGPVYVESTSQNSVFQYVTFDALGFGGNRVSDNTAALDIRSTSCTVTNCIFQNTRGTGLFFEISSTAAVTGNSFNGNRIGIKLGSTSPSVTGNSFSGNSYLDVVSDMDNLGKLKNNGALKIGLTANSPMALNDTLLSTHSYRVLSTLIVTEGKTLTIQPGVNVQFPAIRNPILYLDVKGILIAKGQSGKNIVFSGDGGGIDSYDYYNVSGPVYVESTSQNSVFQYVTFDALGFGGNRVSDNTAALDIRSTSCTVTNCIFQNTRGTGLFFEISSTAAVTGNSFNGNRIGIKLGSTSPSVTGNSFSGNSYLDVVSDMDNLGKLKNNGALKIGLTANSPMALNDTLLSTHSYRVLSTLIVTEGKTLTIQPGVNVQFPAIRNPILYLDIKGILIAKGQSGKNIVFSGDGGGIDSYDYYNVSGPVYVESTSQNSVFQYVTFDALGFGGNRVSDNTAALDIRSTSCTVTNCIFQNTRGVGIVFNASAVPTISANNFSGNTRGDITSDALSLKNISSNSNATINVLASTLNQNALWPNPGSSSQYLLKGTIIINPTYKLTIAAGTKVLLNDYNANLVIQGALSAIGTKTDKIRFESAGTGFGGTISFDSTSKGSSLIYVSTSKLGSVTAPARSAAVDLKTGSITIRNSSFSNSEQNGIIIRKGSPTILQSSFTNNKTGVLSAAGKAKFVKCTFTGNSVYGINNTSATSTDIVDARSCWWGDASGPFQSTTNPKGLGDSVSLKVLYKPFATKPFEPNDIGITNILLSSSCDLSSAEQIKVRIKNFGIEEQSGFNVSYKINKDSIVTENVGSLKIPTDSTADYTFTKTVNLSVPNRPYNIRAFTSLPADTILSNDSVLSVIKNSKPNLGKDTAVKICKESFVNLWKLYDTTGYKTKKWSLISRPDSAGVGTFTLIVTNAQGCADTAVATVTAYVLPTPTISASGNTTLCKGASVTLTSSPAPSYLWSNGAVTSNISVTQAGNYYVTTSNDTGCHATSAATVVQVNEAVKPTLTYSGPLNLCPNTSVILTSSTNDSYYSFAWSTNAKTQSITVNTPGSYTVTATDLNGCRKTSDPAIVTQTCEKPAALKSSSITASSAKLSWDTITCATGYSLQYHKTGTTAWTTIKVTGISQTITGLTAGTSYDWSVSSICQTSPLIQSDYAATVKFTTASGSLKKSGDIVNTGNDDQKLSAVVYPVPVTNNAATLIIKNSNANSIIRLIDMSGRVLWVLNNVGDGKFVLPVSKISAGTYIVNVFNSKENVIVKFVKQ